MSWKTTLFGILGIIGTTITMVAEPLLDLDPATVPDWAAYGVALATSIGLLFSRDHDKSSEEAGIK